MEERFCNGCSIKVSRLAPKEDVRIKKCCGGYACAECFECSRIKQERTDYNRKANDRKECGEDSSDPALVERGK